MKKILFIILTSFVVSGCGVSTHNSDDLKAEELSIVEYSYKERYVTLDDVIESADCIVKATMTSIEDFNGYLNEYCYSIEEDYTGNAETEIYVYDAKNEAYIEGHTYFLFLQKDEIALYPHSIYTSIAKDCVLDIAFSSVETEIMGTLVTVELGEAEEKILEKIEENNRDTVRMGATEVQIMKGRDVSEISDAADIVAEICVSKEEKGNKYVSAYEVEVIEVQKGDRNGIATHMLLPPDLKEDRSYYVFLKGDGEECLLFARDIPVVEATAEVTKELILEK